MPRSPRPKPAPDRVSPARAQQSHDHRATGTGDTMHLPNRSPRIGRVVQRSAAVDDVEGRIAEGQMLGFSLAQLGRESGICQLFSRSPNPDLSTIDADGVGALAHPLRQIATSAGPDLQHVATAPPGENVRQRPTRLDSHHLGRRLDIGWERQPLLDPGAHRLGCTPHQLESTRTSAGRRRVDRFRSRSDGSIHTATSARVMVARARVRRTFFRDAL